MAHREARFYAKPVLRSPEDVMTRVRSRCLLLASATLCLSACGGGGGGGIASTPPPPVTPPPPASDKPIPPPHLGLVSAAPLSSLAEGDTYTADANGNHVSTVSAPSPQNVQFSYNAATDGYLITLPGFSPGTLG